jgi:hypothetical protein
LSLWHQDQQRWERLQQDIRIAPLLPQTQRLPSLLGWDVLRHFRLVLDHSAGSVEVH